jgi:hypothetical protein
MSIAPVHATFRHLIIVWIPLRVANCFVHQV